VCNGLCADDADAVQGLSAGITDGDIDWDPPNTTEIRSMSRSDALATVAFDPLDISAASMCSLQVVLFSDLARSTLPPARVRQLEDPYLSARSIDAIRSVIINRFPACAPVSLAASWGIMEVLDSLYATGLATLLDGSAVDVTNLTHGILWSDEPLRSILSVTIGIRCGIAPLPSVLDHVMRALRLSVDDSALLWVPNLDHPRTPQSDLNTGIAAQMQSTLFPRDLSAANLLKPSLSVEGWTVASNWKRGSFNDTVTYAVCTELSDFDAFAVEAPVVVPSTVGMPLAEIASGDAASRYSIGPALAAAGSWFPVVAGNPPRTVSVAGLGCYEAWANGSLYMEQGNYDASSAYLGGCPACGNRSAAALGGRCNAAGGLSCDGSGSN